MDPETLDRVGIGATGALSLRVSVASLVRVLLMNPRDGTALLALERKATLVETAQGSVVEVKAQPFGGAVRIRDVKALHELIGDFHFDSERSRSEADFRLFIRPSSWPTLRAVCIEHLSSDNDPLLESDPGRELKEEFFDALQIELQTGQYTYKPVRMVVEDQPSPTENPRARGYPTVHIYRVFEAAVRDPALAQAMIENSNKVSDQVLRERAMMDAQSGGRGRANAVLVLPLRTITDLYEIRTLAERNAPMLFNGYWLEKTVVAVQEGSAS